MTAGPLAGQRVVITRASHQAGELAEAFRHAGAGVEFLPLLEVTAPDDPEALAQAAREAGAYDWLVFTSANAVDAFLPLLEAPLGGEVKLAVVGPATARAARRHGVEPRLEASRSDAEGLVRELAPKMAKGERILVPQADDARPALVEGLEALGHRVTAVEAYSKRLPPGAAERARELFDGREIGWVTFTSPRIVRHFAELFGDAWEERRSEVRAVSIGPVTTRELRERGVGNVAESARPSPEHMLRAAVSPPGRK